MKKIFLSVLAVAAAFTFTACSDSDLDSTNYTEANTDNYPASPSDLNRELAALYGVMNQYAVDPLQTPWFINNLMSDDSNGAGGTGDVECHAIGHLMSNKEALLETAWKSTYVGIARANSIIDAATKMKFDDEATQNQLIGEALFMRGLFYLWGTQMWGDIPAYWTAAAPDPCLRQSAKDVIYPHILGDFYEAAQLMNKTYTDSKGDGHATIGAAQGYLARAYMFYQGFYNGVKDLSSETPATMDVPGTYLYEAVTLSKNDVINELKDCVAKGGYSLVKDFRLLWQYTNELSAQDYDYVKDLKEAKTYWAGNGNSEEVFQVQFGNMASWNGTIGMGFTNMTSLYCGLRCDDNGAGVSNGTLQSVPFGQGWGQGTINANLWDEWSDSDPRKMATILDAPTELKEGVGFVFTTSCSEDAGYYNKKLLPCTTVNSTFSDNTDAYTWWGVYRKANTEGVANNNGNSFQGDHFGDIYLMRYADILLMLSELTGDASYMNQVRERAGLQKVANYSLSLLQDERRWEFAGEGIRFNDLRRWSGQNGGEGCMAAKALEKQNGTRVNYCGTWTKMKHASSSWAKRYAETDGFLQIPPKQIEIVNNPDVLTQNKGWGSDVSDWSMSGTPVY